MSTEITLKREEAVEQCSNEKTSNNNNNLYSLPTLVEIHSAEEQQLINDYLFSNFTIFDNVWIRAKRGIDNEFYWSEGRPVNYTNWEPNSPTNNQLRGCVVITSGLGRKISSYQKKGIK